MATRQSKNSYFSRLVVPAFCTAIIGYFGFHAYEGNLGYKSGQEMQEETLQLQFELSRLAQHRKHLEHRVSLLRHGSIEKDMLDQHVRENLNLIHSNEVLILPKR